MILMLRKIATLIDEGQGYLYTSAEALVGCIDEQSQESSIAFRSSGIPNIAPQPWKLRIDSFCFVLPG